MCRSRGKCLIINSSYHICILSIFSWLHYNITYLSWFATSYGYPFVMVSMWSYHWNFRYSFIFMPLWEWMYSSPQYTSKYYHNYCFGKWNTCSKGSLSHFPLPHLTTSGCFYHQRQLLDFNECCHCWSNSHKYGVASIDDDNTCDNNDCLGENMIICWTNVKQWFHSPCYLDVWVFSFLFWFVFIACA
jgi:hypothetical protein